MKKKGQGRKDNNESEHPILGGKERKQGKARLKNTIIDKARLKYHLDRCFLIYLFALCSFFFCCCYFFVNKILNIVLGLIMYILKE